MLEINANLKSLSNLKKFEWQASEKYLTSMLAQYSLLLYIYNIVRGAAPVSREEGSFELDPYGRPYP